MRESKEKEMQTKKIQSTFSVQKIEKVTVFQTLLLQQLMVTTWSSVYEAVANGPL